MLALYDGGPRRIDRVVRGKMFVENWSAVPVGHIQPAKVRQLVDGLSDDGLLQRFMIVMPPRVEPGDPDDDDISTDWHAIDRFAQIVEILFAHAAARDAGPRRQAGVLRGRGGARACTRSGGGCSGWSSASRPIPILPAPLKEATSKWRGLLARLSLVFHCVELAEARLRRRAARPGRHAHAEGGDGREGVQLHHADRGAEHLPVPHRDRQHRRSARPTPGGSPATCSAGRLQSITARDIGRAYREIRGRPGRDRRHHGSARPRRAGCSRTRERPRDTAWLVNPRVHHVFAAQAAAEKARRDAVREQVRVSIAELAR